MKYYLSLHVLIFRILFEMFVFAGDKKPRRVYINTRIGKHKQN